MIIMMEEQKSRGEDVRIGAHQLTIVGRLLRACNRVVRLVEVVSVCSVQRPTLEILASHVHNRMKSASIHLR
jgi:hypothetical protein